MEDEEKFPVQTYNSKELADRLKISTKTLRKWVAKHKKAIGPRIGNFYTPKQVKTIIEKVGKPISLLLFFAAKIYGDGDVGESKK